MQDFTDIAKKIENRASKVIEALQQESESLEKVEETLNKRYQESVTNVLSSLKYSMEEQEKKLIVFKTNEALNLITTMTEKKVLQTEEEINIVQEKMTNVHKEMLEAQQQTLIMMKQGNQKQTKIQAKQWMIPTIIGIAIVIGMAIGTWAVTERLSNQLLALQELEQMIADTKKTQDKYVKKVWKNGISVESQPSTWQDPKSGLWVIEYEKIE